MSTSLRPPQLVVQQNFAARPAGTARSLQPFIYGSLASLIRYDVASERENGFLGTYDDDPAVVEGVAQSLYSWPNLPLGNTVDQDYTELFVESGLFRYFRDITHTAAINVARNKVRLPTTHLRSFGATPSNVIDGGVVNGDLVLVKGVTTGAAPFSVPTYVIGVEGDPVAATVGVPVAASSNITTRVAADTETPAAGNSGDLTLTASATNYDGLATGHLSETYEIEVIVGGAPGTARLSVTSLSGTDNTADLVTVALATPLTISPRGGQVTFAAAGGSAFVLGDKWTVTLTQAYTASSGASAGTYTGLRDRVYIVEVTQGGTLNADPITVAVSSQDGTDTLLPQTVSTDTVNLGSYGLTFTFTAASGLSKGEKFTVAATAASEGNQRTLVLANELPTDVALDDTANLEISIYKSYDTKIARESHLAGLFNYTGEASQLRVRGDIQLTRSDVTLSGTPIAMPLESPSEFTSSSRLYVTTRSWYPTGTDIFSISSETDLDSALEGPTHPDNPLKYGISLCRLGAVGETIHGFNVGDPSVINNWNKALTYGGRSDACYGYAPLSQDPDVLVASAAAVATANSENRNMYRVLWTSSAYVTGGSVLDATTTSNDGIALAVVEDDAGATGTQFTQVRLTSGNADFLALGVRPGDFVRYLYAVDAWGGESYVERVISEVRSATTVIVSVPFAASEAVPKRLEVHRVYDQGELRDHYAAEASQWASDLVRHVVAPVVSIGSYELGAHFITPILSGMRASSPAQQPLSTYQVPGVLRISGLDEMGESALDELAGSGAYICHYRYNDNTVRIRHAITTGDTDIIAKREESMVSARHAALFVFASRLAPYAGRSNSSEGDDFDILVEQITSEMSSAAKQLQTVDFAPEIGGVISSLNDLVVKRSATQADELIVSGTMLLGKPNNRVTFQVLIG